MFGICEHVVFSFLVALVPCSVHQCGVYPRAPCFVGDESSMGLCRVFFGLCAVLACQYKLIWPNNINVCFLNAATVLQAKESYKNVIELDIFTVL